MSAHTPGKVEALGWDIRVARTDENMSGFLLASVDASPLLERHENAQRISLCWNLHDELTDALERMAAQHRCGCGHPACNRCSDDRDNAALIVRARP